MGWPATLTVGMVSGIAGLALALVVGDAVAKAHRVSTFEGASGYLVVFVFGPLGFLAGLGVGIAIALLSEGAGVGGFLRVQALALAATGVAIGGVGGLAVLVADTPPTIDGQLLVLEVEIRTPATVGTVEELKAGGFRPSVSEDRSSQSSDVRFEEATTRDGQFVIPATASLYAHSSDRAFLIARDGNLQHVYELRTPAKPTKADATWSPWQKARTPLNEWERNAATSGRTFEIRYRVVPKRQE